MLLFTKPQEAHVLNTRRQFNAQQGLLNTAMGSDILIGNALPVPRDVWGEWDTEAVEIQRSTLAVFNDLARTVSTPMPLGKLVHHFQTVSDSGEANISLDGRQSARRDQQVYDYHGTPLPIVDSTFGYGWRQMLAAQSEGIPLDSAGRMNAMRRVAEKLESIALDGDTSIVVGGNPLYGLRNHPNRNTRSTGVTLNGATGAQWLAEVNATVKLLHNKNFKVPVTLYVNFDDWFYAQNTDFKAESDKTIAQRVMETGGVREVVVSDSVNADQLIALVKDRRVVQVLNGMPIATLPRFRANPEDDYDFRTMAAAAVEIKFDAESQCGVAVST
ncbi:major capsid protein [Litorimonas haliclonae]|uniref:major capsid protein n=1 Tax=Litorimonas haliclonae TaxID=2081977 RepID=UPI0039EEF037